MRILVVGAGAMGGYFGGRLLEAGRDVTFLVRPRRAAQLAKTGLIIRSKFGDASLSAPPTVATEALHGPFDLILLSCKAYDLKSAADSFAPAVGKNTAILPFLNGMAHIDYLVERFGRRPHPASQRHALVVIRRARWFDTGTCGRDCQRTLRRQI
jgi:2-dehydropantoate 2-reductase